MLGVRRVAKDVLALHAAGVVLAGERAEARAVDRRQDGYPLVSGIHKSPIVEGGRQVSSRGVPHHDEERRSNDEGNDRRREEHG